jgi:hypothetical protein
MANQRIGNRIGVAARNASSGAQKTNMNGSTSVSGELEDTDMASITALRSRLAAIDAGYYTSARLDALTYNDMVYAVRVNDQAGSI